MKFTKKQILIIGVLILAIIDGIAIFFVVNGNESLVGTGEEERQEFAYDCVIVDITEERSNMDKEYTLDEFKEVKLISIKEHKDVSDLFGYDFLTLYLKNPSKKNVLKAVELLKNNPIVKYCGPNYIDYDD